MNALELRNKCLETSEYLKKKIDEVRECENIAYKEIAIKNALVVAVEEGIKLGITYAKEMCQEELEKPFKQAMDDAVNLYRYY